MSRRATANGLLALNQIESCGSFINYNQTRLDKQKAGEVVPNPYAQSESMVRYLIRNMQRRDDLVALLENVRATEGFNSGFHITFGNTILL